VPINSVCIKPRSGKADPSLGMRDATRRIRETLTLLNYKFMGGFKWSSHKFETDKVGSE